MSSARFVGAIGLAVALAGPGSVSAQKAPPASVPAPRPVANAVAATVNGQPIYEAAVQRSLERVEAGKRKQARPEIINYFVDNLLIDQHLKQLGVSVDRAAVEAELASMKAELKKDKRDFERELAAMKVTEAEFRETITAHLRWTQFSNKQATDAVLKQVFDGEKDLFDGSAVRARHILISVPPDDVKAEAAVAAQLRAIKKHVEDQVAAGLAKLPAGSDALAREKARTNLITEAFGALAREKSDCPSKSRNGDVSWFQKAGFMVASFSRAAFALQPAQMSDVVRTPFGCHLILVTDRRPGRAVRFEDVREMVKAVYCDRLRDQLVGDLRTKARIVVEPAR